MALTKPTSFPRWNTGGLNRTEPTSGKKDTGWVLNEEPSSSFFNWLLHFGGLFDQWHDERMLDGLPGGGGDSEDFLIQPPTPVAAGGKLTTKGADGVGAGSAGGAVDVAGGDAPSGNAAGGAANIDGGAGSGTGNGGFANITGGPGGATGTGGDAQVEAGTTSDGTGATALVAGGLVTGTDQNGGLAVVRGGVATGDGSSDAVLRAVDGNQGAGATSRSPSDYLRCDGSAKVITTSRSMVITATDATRAPVRLVASTRPATPARGDAYVSSVGDNSLGKSYIHTGSRWEGIGSLRVATTTDSNSVSGTTVETAFNQKDTIPADFAQLTDLIELKAGGSGLWAAGSINVRVKLGGEELLEFTYTPIGGFFWKLDCDIIIDNAGVSGNVRSKGGALFNETSGLTGIKSHTVNTTTHASPIAFTASNDLEITAQWTSAAGGNSITMHNLSVDIR